MKIINPIGGREGRRIATVLHPIFACILPLFIFLMMAWFPQRGWGQCPVQPYVCVPGNGTTTSNVITLTFEAGNNANDASVASNFLTANPSLTIDGEIYTGVQSGANVTYTSVNPLGLCPTSLAIGLAAGCATVSEDNCYQITFYDDFSTNNCSSSNGRFSFDFSDVGSCGPYVINVSGNSALGPFNVALGATVHLMTGTIKAGVYIFTITDGNGDITYAFYNHTTHQEGTCETISDLQITKEILSGNPYSAVGDLITYKYTISATGSNPITGPVKVIDDKIGEIIYPGNIAAGGSVMVTATYTVTQADIDAGSVINTAFATNGSLTSGVDMATAIKIPCNAAAGIISAPAEVCPGATLNVSTSGHNNTTDYGQLFFIDTDQDGIIDAVNNTGSFSAPQVPPFVCGDNISVYSFNYLLTDFPTAPVPGDPLPICPVDGCCDLVSTVVSVNDQIPPTITCPAAPLTIECGASLNPATNAALSAWLNSASATDACSTPVVTNNYSSTGFGVSTSQIVTFTATDGCGRTSTCTATINIVDTTNPSITCPAAPLTIQCGTSVNPATNAALATWLSSASATDACGAANVTNNYNQASFSDGCGATGSQTVTFTATDTNNRTSTCTAVINIVDTTNPAITCPATPLTVQCGASLNPGTNAALSAWLTSASANDACGSASVSNNYSQAGFSDLCGVTGSQTVTFTATDLCGRTSTCTATINIVDTTNPAITCPAAPLTVQCGASLDPMANAALLTWLNSASATDACGSASVSNNYNQAGFSDLCGATGSQTVTFTATDACNRTSTCTATINIVDTTNPSITCPPKATVYMDVNCKYDLSKLAPATASDLCSSVTLIFTDDVSSVTGCFNSNVYGTIRRTWTVTDGCGKKSSCMQSIDVIDNTPPTITCNSATIYTDANCKYSLQDAPVSVGDNCDKNITLTNTIVESLTNGAGTVTVTWMATDDCGNTQKCVQTLTVIDNKPPVALCQTNKVKLNLGADGTGVITWQQVNNNSSDNCGISSYKLSKTNFTCSDIGEQSVTLTVTDVHGLTSTCTATIQVLPFISMDVQVTHESCTGMSDGKIVIIASAPIGPLIYSIDDGKTFSYLGTFEKLTPGTYKVLVRVLNYDINSPCMGNNSATITINAGKPAQTWYQDLDNDGYRCQGVFKVACFRPPGFKLQSELISMQEECNDYDPNITIPQTWYKDWDNDGYSDGITTYGCSATTGYKTAAALAALPIGNQIDCNDNLAATSPATPEICNGKDDNCNGQIDESAGGGLTWVGNLTFTSQSQINSFSACYSVIQGNVAIQGTGIISLAALSNIKKISGNVTIKSTALKNLTGFNNLTMIGGTLHVSINNYGQKLSSLTGLEALVSVGGQLQIYYNFTLTDCCPIKKLLTIPGSVVGGIYIHHNLTTCDSPAQITMNCASPNLIAPDYEGLLSFPVAQQQKMSKVVTLSPNPVSDVVTVSVESPCQSGTFRLMNLQGQEVFFISLDEGIQTFSMDVHDLSPGAYLVKVVLDGETFTEKLLVK
jgi:hypothetical protein